MFLQEKLRLFAEIPNERFSNLRLVTNETSEFNAVLLKWDPPINCSIISGKIRGAKLLIRKTREHVPYMTNVTANYSFPLLKSSFDGAETFQVHLHVLRELKEHENSSAYTSLIFKIPDRG